MATKFFFRDLNSSLGIANEFDKDALLTAGPGVTIASTNTVAGPTAGVQVVDSRNSPFDPLAWYSKPLDGVTISGTITFNVWMAESSMSANVGAQVIVERTDGSGSVISTISNSEKGTEVPVTTRAAQNWTATPTSTTLSAGDRIRIRVLGNDIGTMASGFNFSFSWDGPTAGSDGDSFVSFTETITEQAATRVPYFQPYPPLLAQ